MAASDPDCFDMDPVASVNAGAAQGALAMEAGKANVTSESSGGADVGTTVDPLWGVRA